MTILTSGGVYLTNGAGLHLANAQATPPTPTSVTVPAVMLTFDDGGITQYSEVFSYMNARGMKGTLYAVSSFVDTSGMVTTAQLLEMDAAGWDIGNHTTDHTDLTTLTQAQVEAKISGCTAWLESKGLTRASKHVGYPYGNQNATVLAAMANIGMTTGRTVENALATLPPSNVYTIPAYNFDTGRTLDQAKAIVDSAVSQNKVACAYLHNIMASPDTWSWAISNFRGLIDYIQSLGLPTITINEYYTGVYA